MPRTPRRYQPLSERSKSCLFDLTKEGEGKQRARAYRGEDKLQKLGEDQVQASPNCKAKIKMQATSMAFFIFAITFGVEAFPSSLTPKKIASLCKKYNHGDDDGACAPDRNHNINNNPEHMVGYIKLFTSWVTFSYLCVFSENVTALPNKGPRTNAGHPERYLTET
ncbi:hypothetical protein Tco_0592901 [Tanacetum coccineum]